MDEEQFEAIVGLSLMAAFADGRKDEDEREKLKEIFESFGSPGAETYRQVMLGETSIEDLASRLHEERMRALAFEMATAVCDADGATSSVERTFLEQLREALALEDDVAARVIQESDEVAEAELAAGAAAVDAVAVTPPVPPASQSSKATDAVAPEVDSMIIKYAVLNGALELLPQSLATMAILPLQMKMVYRIGSAYGFELSQSHIKEFLAVGGLGLGSQIIENFARKFIGKVAKKSLGKSAGRIAKGATGPALTFASTYAMGQAAKAYYGGGRTLSMDQVKELFNSQVGEAQQLYQSYAPRIEQQAQGLNVTDVMAMVRGR